MSDLIGSPLGTPWITPAAWGMPKPREDRYRREAGRHRWPRLRRKHADDR